MAIYDTVEPIPQELSDVLPAVHSFTGCDTASKVSVKCTTIKNVTKDYYHFLASCFLAFEFRKSNLKVVCNRVILGQLQIHIPENY